MKYDNAPDEWMETLLQKDFTELSHEEQDFALKQTGSKETYGQLRATLLTSRHMLSTPVEGLLPDPRIHARLQTVLQSRQKIRKERSTLRDAIAALFTYKIPAYQAGFALIVLAGFFLFFRGSSSVPQSVSQTLAGVIDTIKTEIRSDSVIGGYKDTTPRPLHASLQHSVSRKMPARYHEDSIAVSSRTMEMAHVRSERAVFVGMDHFPMLETQKRGRKMSEDTALAKFRGTAF